MTDKNKESRINIEDLPQEKQELTAEEAKQVKGGLTKVGAGTQAVNNTKPFKEVGGLGSEVEIIE